MSDEPAIPRTMSEELAAKLHDNITWIDLRTKLITMLHAQVGEGDPRAREQLDFLVKNWPGGAGPRQNDFVALEQRLRSLERDLLNLKNYVKILKGEQR